MSLEKITVIDQIEVTESGHVQVRQATKIIENGMDTMMQKTHGLILLLSR